MHLLNRRAVRVTLLVALILVGGALRFTDINWDRFQHLHPDERFIVWVADTMDWPSEVEGGLLAQLGVALDPERSPLNPLRWPPDADDLAGQPRNFAYGHLPLYLLVAAGHVAAAVGRWFGETTLAFPAWMQPLHTVGRQLADYSHLTLVGTRSFRPGRSRNAPADLRHGRSCRPPPEGIRHRAHPRLKGFAGARRPGARNRIGLAVKSHRHCLNHWAHLQALSALRPQRHRRGRMPRVSWPRPPTLLQSCPSSSAITRRLTRF